MTDVSIEVLPPAELHVLDLWAAPELSLPRAGRAEGPVMRTGPTTWLIEGDVAAMAAGLGGAGALAPVGGGIVRVRLSGPEWRSLLMEGGLFDAEGAAFGPDCVATTLIDHVTVTLRVESEQSCLAYVPASYAEGLLHFWRTSALTLP